MQKHVESDSVFLPILEVLSAGSMQFRKAADPMPMEVHDNAFELLLLTSGVKSLILDDQLYTMRGGDMLLIHPGEKHGNPQEIQSKSALKFIIFRDPAATRGFLDMATPERLQLGKQLKRCRSVRPNAALQASFDACFQAAWRKDRLFATRLRASLFLLLDTLVQEQPDSGGIAALPDDIARVLRLIDQEGEQRLTVENMARAANLSVPYFQQKFKRSLGVPPAEYLVRARIASACRMLSQTDSSITEIAFQLGFSSSQHFALLFKRYTGFTPSAYRRMNPGM